MRAIINQTSMVVLLSVVSLTTIGCSSSGGGSSSGTTTGGSTTGGSTTGGSSSRFIAAKSENSDGQFATSSAGQSASSISMQSGTMEFSASTNELVLDYNNASRVTAAATTTALVPGSGSSANIRVDGQALPSGVTISNGNSTYGNDDHSLTTLQTQYGHAFFYLDQTAFDSDETMNVRFGHYGYLTDNTQVPTSGTANYSGNVEYVIVDANDSDSENLASNSGSNAATFAANFNEGTITGESENIAYEDHDIDLDFQSASIVDSTFNGTMAVSIAGPIINETPTGVYNGAFYGPEAAEMLGGFSGNSSDGTLGIAGVIVTDKQ